MRHITINTPPDILTDTEIAWLRQGESESYDVTLYPLSGTLIVDRNEYLEDSDLWVTRQTFAGDDAVELLEYLKLNLFDLERTNS